MQLVNAEVALGGDQGNTVPKYGITPTEIAVLRAIHGDEAVLNIEPVGEVKRSHRDELARIKGIYGNARTGENEVIVEVLFPGMAARVFETLEELGVDESFMKPASRVSATLAPKPAEEDPQPEGLSSMTVAELKALATARRIDLGDATKKAEIIAAIEDATPVTDDDEPDDIAPMADAKGDTNLFQ